MLLSRAILSLLTATAGAVERVNEGRLQEWTTASDAHLLPSQLFLPRSHSSKELRPVLIFLHGAGDGPTEHESSPEHLLRPASEQGSIIGSVCAKEQAHVRHHYPKHPSGLENGAQICEHTQGFVSKQVLQEVSRVNRVRRVVIKRKRVHRVRLDARWLVGPDVDGDKS